MQSSPIGKLTPKLVVLENISATVAPSSLGMFTKFPISLPHNKCYTVWRRSEFIASFITLNDWVINAVFVQFLQSGRIVSSPTELSAMP